MVRGAVQQNSKTALAIQEAVEIHFHLCASQRDD